MVVALDFSRRCCREGRLSVGLERAKRELEQLMDGLAGDRIGLVAFAARRLSYPPRPTTRP